MRVKKMILAVATAVTVSAVAETVDEPEPGATTGTSGFVEFVEPNIIPLISESPEEAPPAPGPEVPPPATAPPPPAATQEAPPAAEPQTVRRDPFWPINYQPPPPRESPEAGSALPAMPPPAGEPRWEEALKTVSVQGLMKTGAGTYVAVVNGQVLGADEEVSVLYAGRLYRWRIVTVSEQGVSFARVDSGSPPLNNK